jgi:DNA-binding transcriptional MerR regulator
LAAFDCAPRRTDIASSRTTMTAAAILKLQRAGFTEEQVEALADYFDEQLANKADLAAAVEQIRGEVKAAEARLNTTIEQVRGELKTADAQLETKIEQARADTIKWVIGVGFAQAATILPVLRLFPGHP